jgi:hypothetical protein
MVREMSSYAHCVAGTGRAVLQGNTDKNRTQWYLLSITNIQSFRYTTPC